jgi:hypothetical protein
VNDRDYARECADKLLLEFLSKTESSTFMSDWKKDFLHELFVRAHRQGEADTHRKETTTTFGSLTINPR